MWSAEQHITIKWRYLHVKIGKFENLLGTVSIVFEQIYFYLFTYLRNEILFKKRTSIDLCEIFLKIHISSTWMTFKNSQLFIQWKEKFQSCSTENLGLLNINSMASGKGVATFPTPHCSSYWKGSLHVTLHQGRQLYYVTSSSNSYKIIVLYNCGRIFFILSFFFLYILSFGLVRTRTFRHSAWFS